jgi:small conductance mechanosensitive channel
MLSPVLNLFRPAIVLALASIGVMLAAVWVCEVFLASRVICDALLVIVRVGIVLVMGVLVIRSADAIADRLEAMGVAYAGRRGWGGYYEQLRPLVPTFRACLDYVLWVGLISLALFQLPALRPLAAWGPLVVEAIGIFFLGRVAIELGYLEIGHRMLPREGLAESDRRRRATMVPLVRSTFTYAGYFGTAVLMLGALGFNPMPFLAGAGILGLVVGFGAQSMINDVVSGFFILFENIYLVGDTIESGSAHGVVEAIEFRTTKIRDSEGRVHIVRNGDMKLVVNHSKEYAVAIVTLDVAYDADVRAVFAALGEAGARLRAENRDVLGDTDINGIVAFGATSMTVRTSTRVKAGQHESTAAALRLYIKDAFDRHIAAGTARTTLIPQPWNAAAAPASQALQVRTASH